MARFIFTFFFICSLFLNLNAFPVAIRQAAQPQATTVQTTKTANTPAGQMITTCEITLTPIKDSNGQDAVEEVTKCKVAMDGVNNGAAPPSSSSASQGGQASPTDAPATTSNAAPSDTAPTQSVVTATVTTDTAAAAAASSPPGSDPAAQPTDAGASPASSPAPPSTTASPPATTAAPAATTAAAAISPNGVSTVAVADLSSLLTATTSGTAAQQNESATATPSASAAAAFELPGSKLSVLPIGLGVFAGISVIALIVVGLVTYERTKYRKAFRQRKLAEQGSSMGYGGNMAEVRA